MAGEAPLEKKPAGPSAATTLIRIVTTYGQLFHDGDEAPMSES
jgi:hypothetical protein